MTISDARQALGVGLYSYTDAARLIGGNVRELRRWVVGGPQDETGTPRTSGALWSSQLKNTSLKGIGFRDLLELRFVKAFRESGVSLQAIRAAAEAAKALFGGEHPFTNRRFQTDGRSIFVTIHEETGDESLVEIARRQHVFREIVGPSLYAGIEFNGKGAAQRWFPVPRSKVIVLDPRRGFGQPILTQSGIPTAAIADAYRAEKGDAAFVARIYSISADTVRKAVVFENRHTEAA